MEKKWYITYFLLFISMVMLVVPVVPHHHHADGLICMKNDVTTDCCKQNHNPGNDDHCCDNTGCVTTHFVQRSPSSDSDTGTHLEGMWAITLYFEPLFKLLAVPEIDVKRQDNIYFESLHGTFITRATGLRAPPSVLA